MAIAPIVYFGAKLLHLEAVVTGLLVGYVWAGIGGPWANRKR